MWDEIAYGIACHIGLQSNISCEWCVFETFIFLGCYRIGLV